MGSSGRGSEKEQLLVSGRLLQHLLFWGRSRPRTRVVHKEFPACVTCTRQRSKWANPAIAAPTDRPVTGTNILQNFRETEPISSGSMRVLCLLNTLRDYQRRRCSAQQLACVHLWWIWDLCSLRECAGVVNPQLSSALCCTAELRLLVHHYSGLSMQLIQKAAGWTTVRQEIL